MEATGLFWVGFKKQRADSCSALKREAFERCTLMHLSPETPDGMVSKSAGFKRARRECQANQIFPLPVEPVGDGARLPVGEKGGT